MRSFDICRRNAFFKHALAKACYAVVYTTFRSHRPCALREYERIRLLVFDVGEILRYTSKATECRIIYFTFEFKPTHACEK